MNQHSSDSARIASTREVDCWENEGGADRAPHQKDSDPPNHEGDATLQWEAKVKRLVTPKKFPTEGPPTRPYSRDAASLSPDECPLWVISGLGHGLAEGPFSATSRHTPAICVVRLGNLIKCDSNA
jgi:hypothetical protein